MQNTDLFNFIQGTSQGMHVTTRLSPPSSPTN
jgi:hypothetical protein